MTPRIALIVEGQGDEAALPILVRRIGAALDPPVWVSVAHTIRRSRDRLVQRGVLEADVEAAARVVHGEGAVLVVIDGDGEPPCTLGPALLARARAARPDLPLAVVLAHREYEAWLLAGAASLRGRRGLAADLAPPPDPEGIAGAKEWLSHRMAAGRRYSETRDQPALTEALDLEAARRLAPSFDKLYRDVTGLLTALGEE